MPENFKFSSLESTAQQVAERQQKVFVGQTPRYLLRRLPEQAKLLEDSYQAYRDASQVELVFSAAAEWMLDNFYVVQQVLRQVKKDLTPAYYDDLPKLIMDEADEHHQFPRVYALTRHYILQEQCQVQIDNLHQFLQAYQAVTPLTMGEVWALPIMLRISLLACLAQANGRITQLLPAADELRPALRFTSPAEEHDKDIVASAITSLRLLATMDWQTFFEQVNLAEQTLRQDPAHLYGRMTFVSRDQYRKIVEKYAKATGHSEIMVAQTAVNLALASGQPLTTSDEDPWAGLDLDPHFHVGFYLAGTGKGQLEQALGYQPTGAARLRRLIKRHPLAFYLSGALFFTLLFLALLLSYTVAAAGTWWQLLLVCIVGLIPITAVAISLVNWLITLLIPPQKLPKLNFEEGVPASCRTMVVIPVLLTHAEEIQSLIGQLEQHYLRNPDPHLGFALLSDFGDAPQAEMPADASLKQLAQAGIEALNQRYEHQPFYLFHRQRRYNPSEDVWMGWERKRGKLQEFNQLLRGADHTSFDIQYGDLSRLPLIQYVITLDADTILPADAAQRLIGAIAHPLNRATCDPNTGRVASGYTILQPRTEIQPTSVGQSLFSRVFAGDIGLDLYTLAVSDVYQDLFGEGIFVGKGIYDVDAFECSLAHRVPENSLLSHDLFEGIQGRAGLVTDIVLYEDYPSHYLVFVNRAHRWIRGDWQLLPWLWFTVPAANGRIANDLSALDRWKIFDNLRRSLVAPFLFFFFIIGWLLLPGSPVVWTLVGLLLPGVALLTAAFMALSRFVRGGSWREVQAPVRHSGLRWLLQIAFLPYEALLNLDAIVTTLGRLIFTRQRLLQWTTAARVSHIFGDEQSAEKTAGQMIRPLILVTILALIIIAWQPEALIAAVPIMILWVLASEIAYRVSLPYHEETAVLTPLEQQRLRTLARRTWLFFEEYVGPEDHWLPPDHYQEFPRGVVAHRTSPTNVGLYLLTALAAYDFGYIGLLNLSLRLNSTFDTLARLERYRGHFLNWIDTSSLQHLSPRYVSTVDSGNLAGCLLALKQACLSMQNELVWRPIRWQGLLDTLSLYYEDVEILSSHPNAQHIKDQIFRIQSAIQTRSETSYEDAALILYLREEALPELERLLLVLVEDGTALFTSEMAQHWRLYVGMLHRNLQGMQRDVELLSPWLLFLHQTPAYFTGPEAPPAVVAAWQALQTALPQHIRLVELSEVYRHLETAVYHLQAALETAVPSAHLTAASQWCSDFSNALINARMSASTLLTSYEMLAQQADSFVQEMDYTFLYNAQRHVFHIGYNLENGRLDENYYDLLASEARIASLVAIAKRDIPLKHWLHLARPLTQLPEGLTLLSWSGTMFEYLMPPLLMNSFQGTLLAQSCRTIVARQIANGRQHSMPWGISESGFYAFDNALNYQYHAFGVVGTGFKRGLSEDRVITPYASLLALSIQPRAVLANIDHLRQYHMMGMYGLYEALDFTPSRLESGQKAAVVQSYMAHHQGMIMLALVNTLQNDKMVKRFHAEPTVQSVELLLQEQVPSAPTLQNPHKDEAQQETALVPSSMTADPWQVPLNTSFPQVRYLGNGRLGSLITNAGGGLLQTPDLTLTRWRPDATQDDWGLWLYVQDQESGALWHATRHSNEVRFFPHMVQFTSHQHGINLQTAVTIAPADDIEIRHIHLTNQSDQPRRLRLTSYAEVALADFATDNRHPAFAKLFVESEYLPAENALFFRRRPRAATEKPRLMGHMLVVSSELTRTGAYESDRAAFVGRNRSWAQPAALQPGGAWLTGITGATLDPIMALGQEMTLAPHSSAEVAFLTFTAPSRAELLALAQKYQQWTAVNAAFNEARTQALQDLARLDITTDMLIQAQQLLSLLLYPHKAMRAPAAAIAANTLGQPTLWGHGVSGDFPILLLELADEEVQELLVTLLRAHTYWRQRGLRIDLVILNRQATNYGEPVQNSINRTIRRLESEHLLNKRGGIFIVRADQMHTADETLLRTAARVILSDAAGSLSAQLAPLNRDALALPPFQPLLPIDEYADAAPPLPRPQGLLFDNSYGGFTADGREYAIYLRPNESTPAPWINVIANERVGFLASEAGGGYTWAENSGENRLTAWRNDPVQDMPAEVLYLRDEETSNIWTPTPQPAPDGAPYLVNHGAGYTTYTHHSQGLKQHLRLYVAPDAPLKIIHLRLENCSPRPRRLTATLYAEWVLGPSRTDTQMTIIPAYHQAYSALLVQNPYHTEFGAAVAFMSASKMPHGLTTDRAEFIGRLGDLSQPAALGRLGFSDRVEAGLDPCAVMQIHVDLPPDGSEEIYFLLGQGQDETEALAVIGRFQNEAEVAAAWNATHELWDDVLGAIQVETPDPAMNILLNRWLLYQSLTCRIWGRSALYQSSGAYGFRDQLQDVMCLVHTRPEITRQQLLRAARHQFEAGDVLHWWHPPSGRGVRTRISDDLVWLPYVTAYYVQATGDTAVLDEPVSFLLGDPLAEGEEERYGRYESTSETFSLYEHGCRALTRAATEGRHGLPLMGGGDWNDGMNRVGIEGKGESIWLGWFIASALQAFSHLCRQRGDERRSAQFVQQAEMYRQALEIHGWDGEWYRRAYYDDGTPLGSNINDECRLDAIAQSWGVLTGLARPERARQAMQAVEEHLVREEERLLLLFTPPFNKTPKDPGYIKGYLPGIRENGGQYTHAALWSIWAFAHLGEGEKAEALYRLINPIYRADTAAKAAQYKVEPYVISADVYGVPPHEGRGGWTWYTGSSSWMYRLGIEGILGLSREGEMLCLQPRIPASWPGFKMVYRYGRTLYHITVARNGRGESHLMLDGKPLAENRIPLVDNGRSHDVVLHLPAKNALL
ncbi:MAG: cellobiose phosphorylase [Anaerolinea sp.]|nr:cellobiose phosphorylase [Anaerolinea sp.]